MYVASTGTLTLQSQPKPCLRSRYPHVPIAAYGYKSNCRILDVTARRAIPL
jgi:hypothetical protein